MAVWHASQISDDAFADELLDHDIALGLLVLEHLVKHLALYFLAYCYKGKWYTCVCGKHLTFHFFIHSSILTLPNPT